MFLVEIGHSAREWLAMSCAGRTGPHRIGKGAPSIEPYGVDTGQHELAAPARVSPVSPPSLRRADLVLAGQPRPGPPHARPWHRGGPPRARGRASPGRFTLRGDGRAASASPLPAARRDRALADGSVEFVAIRFRVGALRHFTDVALADLYDRFASAREVLGPAGEAMAEAIALPRRTSGSARAARRRTSAASWRAGARHQAWPTRPWRASTTRPAAPACARSRALWVRASASCVG
jgi:hypothetical protein